MGKPGTPKEEKKPAAEKPAGEKAPAGGHDHAAPKAHAPSAPKGNVGTKVGCLATACKDKDSRFNFCDEHFRQFKFGLITKHGEKVLDFERKFEHYQKWVSSQSSSRGKTA